MSIFIWKVIDFIVEFLLNYAKIKESIKRR